MITFPSGLKFGKGEDSLVDSLFTGSTTNDGWYTVTGRNNKTMRFFTGNGEPLFYIVKNKHGRSSIKFRRFLKTTLLEIDFCKKQNQKQGVF